MEVLPCPDAVYGVGSGAWNCAIRDAAGDLVRGAVGGGARGKLPPAVKHEHGDGGKVQAEPREAVGM